MPHTPRFASPSMPADASSPRIPRRHVLAAAALPWLGLGAARAQEGAIRIAQSTALTGPLGDLGSAMHQGAKAAFAAINARGGVHGKSIELVTRDDAYEVPKALANVEQFLADPSTFALFNCMGTPMIEAMLPKVIDSGVPFFAPFTGAQLSRTKARSVFNIRASYADEAEKLVQHLSTIGIQRIGIVYQNNTFGKEVYSAAKQSMDRLKLPEALTVTVENNASDAGAAAAKLATGNLEAIVIGLAGKPTLEFVKAFRALQRGVTLYALSVMGTPATVKALGADATGMAISQVVPFPWGSSVPVVKEYQAAAKRAGFTDYNFGAMEGFLTAKVMVEGLRRTGRNLTREAFVDAMEKMNDVDLGGFWVSYSPKSHTGSKFVDLTIIGRQGKFLR